MHIIDATIITIFKRTYSKKRVLGVINQYLINSIFGCFIGCFIGCFNVCNNMHHTNCNNRKHANRKIHFFKTFSICSV